MLAHVLYGRIGSHPRIKYEGGHALALRLFRLTDNHNWISPLIRNHHTSRGRVSHEFKSEPCHIESQGGCGFLGFVRVTMLLSHLGRPLGLRGMALVVGISGKFGWSMPESAAN
jgi:hypothetical protein